MSPRASIFVLVISILGCGDDGLTTAVDLQIDADGCARVAIARITLSVQDGEGNEVNSFDATTADKPFPTGVRLVPVGADADRSWRVEAVGFTSDDVPIAWSSLEGGYDDSELSQQTLLFDDACLGIECLDGQTCTRGRCEDQGVSSARHADRDMCPPIVFVDGATGSAPPCRPAWK